jgi:hypothetical protein
MCGCVKCSQQGVLQRSKHIHSLAVVVVDYASPSRAAAEMVWLLRSIFFSRWASSTEASGSSSAAACCWRGVVSVWGLYLLGLIYWELCAAFVGGLAATHFTSRSEGFMHEPHF